MSRFEWIGTSPEYVGPAILPALAVQRALGPERKAARLRYLGGLWRARVAAALPESRFYTLPDEEMRLGLSTVEIPGQDPGRIQQRLRREHGVLVKAMAGSAWAPEIRGLRVSPNVFTSPAELDRFVAGLATIVGG